MKKARKDSFQSKPLPALIKEIRINKSYDKNSYRKIQFGFIPAEMEDKWFIYFENDNLYIHRSWSGFCIYNVIFIKKNNMYFIERVICNDDPNQYNSKKSNQEEQEIVLYLIDRILLNKSVQVPIPTNVKNYVMYSHGLVGNARSNEDVENDNQEFEESQKYLIKFNNEYDEIIEIFSFHLVLKNTITGVPGFEDLNKNEIEYTSLMDEKLKNTKLDEKQLFRYMIVGLLTQIECMKKFTGVTFEEVLKSYCENAQLNRKFELFHKYYGKIISDLSEFDELLFNHLDINITGEMLYKFVIYDE